MFTKFVKIIILLFLFIPFFIKGQVTSSPNPPKTDFFDIYSGAAIIGDHKFWLDSRSIGQTFSLDYDAELKSVTLKTRDKTEPKKKYMVNVGTIDGNNFTPIYSELVKQTASFFDEEFVTWKFNNPIALTGNKEYAFEVEIISSTTGFRAGIPYIQYSGDSYTRGKSFFRNKTTRNISIDYTKDFIFYLDFQVATSNGLNYVGLTPSNGDKEAILTSPLKITFNKLFSKRTGNIIIKDNTSNSQVAIPINDSRVIIKDYQLIIQADDLMSWGSNYSILVDAGSLESTTGTIFGGILDDKLWTFTYTSGDPLVAAANDLQAHIEGTSVLSGPQIAKKKAYIASKRDRLDNSAGIISAFRNLIDAYDNKFGAFFLKGSQATEFYRANVSDEDIHWTIFSIMQYVFDQTFTKESLENPKTLNVIDGFKFKSSANFPGDVSPPTNANVSHVAKISASFTTSFGRDTQAWGLPARKPTGAYLAPGSIVSVTVPKELVNKGYFIRVGAHSWDHEAKSRNPVKRLSRATLTYQIKSTVTTIASPYGGGIYIEVPYGSNEGVVDVTIKGAIRSPYFSAKNFHTTTNADWLNTERNHVAPWADFQSDKFMMQVPTKWIYALDDPTKLMNEWDAAMDAINDLMGFPRIRGKETMYLQADVILRSAVHAPGYPAVNRVYNPLSPANGYQNDYLVRGPKRGRGVATEFHEQGHAYFFPSFANTIEAEVNFLYVAVQNKVYNVDIGDAFFDDYGPGNNVPNNQIENTAAFWMTSFSFSPREQAMNNWESAYQSTGFARLVDLVRLFGWDGLGEYWKSMNYNSNAGVVIPKNNHERLIRLCEKIGVDVSPLWHFWGIHPTDINKLKAEIKSLNLGPCPEIYNLLEKYKTFIPANNAEYQDFCRLWYGREPSITGKGAERERTRQFDSTSHWQKGKWDYSGTDAAKQDGEIYNEATAKRILDRLQYIIDLYYPKGSPLPILVELKEPLNKSININVNTELNWSSYAGSVEYDIQISTDANFINIIDSKIGLTLANYTSSKLEVNKTYFWRVKSRNGCGNDQYSIPFSFTTSNNITSINDDELENMVSIFPNPTNGLLNVNLREMKKNVSYKLLSLDGRNVGQKISISTNKFIIDMNELSNGVYFLVISSQKLNRTYKILKK